MLLKELLAKTKVLKSEGDLNTDIADISYDSRKVKNGNVFVAIPGTMEDGTKFVPMALRNGAAAIVTEKDVDVEGKAVKIIVPSARAALAEMSCAYFGYPSKKLKVVGITGTNGKTTSAYLIDAIFNAAGFKTGLIGTVETKICGNSVASSLTTPESYELQKLFSRMLEEGVTHVVMEVSSHSIAMKRVKGVEFDCAVYTNLSHDHLDFHKTLEAYFDTKMNLFRSIGSSGKTAVFGAVNIDDKYSEAVIEETNGDIITYSLKKKADVSAKIISMELGRMVLKISSGKDVFDVETGLSGEFNAYNILSACACCKGFGISPEIIRNGISSVKNVPGRMEFVKEGQDFFVLVDFAHSPDSLEKILDMASGFKKGNLVLVFGCTGNRDRQKRPIMGDIAAKKADFTIITSDDPHNEDPDLIIREVEKGFSASGKECGRDYIKMSDRKAAIEKSIEIARQNDIVIIAGRGHEKFQEIKGVNVEIDDRVVAKQAIQKRLR